MHVTMDIQSDGVAIVRLVGRFDLVAAGEVRRWLATAVLDGHRRLVVDLDQVPFVDSSGLGALVSGLKAARLAGGDLRIARPGNQARLSLNVTTLDKVLRPYDTLEEALVDYRVSPTC